jgi:plasmid replication initiation protein
MLKLENKYKVYSDFKKKVLEVAKIEINKKTDITYSYKELKTGRKITNLEFFIKKKEEQELEFDNKDRARFVLNKELGLSLEFIKIIFQTATNKKQIWSAILKIRQDFDAKKSTISKFAFYQFKEILNLK